MIWITGASGLLGAHLVASGPAGEMIALRRSRALPERLSDRVRGEVTVDLSSPDEVDRTAADFPPNLVIHSAAATNPGWCEANSEQARSDNVGATEVLTVLCRGLGIPLVHCSTDLVFDGVHAPYAEDDARAPVGVYAATKAEAEDVASSWEQTLIVRLPIMLGSSPSGARSQDEGLRRACARGERVQLFEDEFRTPIHAGLAADLIWQLADTGCRGMIHVAGATRVSRWQLGVAIAETLELDRSRLERSNIAGFSGFPPRCPDVSLRTDRLEQVLGRAAPTLEESLALLAKECDGWSIGR